ncbi:hypothetical protein HYX17_01470 [Candidatus Woesearchaeota archaeon]|nr:hypothetical protein [Candidatus Woesearchaeota archaeon]
MYKIKDIIFIICIIIILSISPVYAWFSSPLPDTDHKEFTDQAIESVKNNDTLDSYNELTFFTNKFFVKVGSDIIDPLEWTGYKPKNKPGYIDFDFGHFYHPNGSSYNNQWPSALEESYDWLEEAITDYSKGEKSSAYTKLGHMIHLLEDMAVPAHTHLISHGEDIVDYFEFKADSKAIDASNKDPIRAYSPKGNELYAIEKQFNELARKSYNESNVQNIINTYYEDGSYIGSNQDCDSTNIFLRDRNCSPQISSADITTLQDDLMPKAVQYSAGLAMIVQDIFNSLDWPMFHHDLRRTGFTLLKGDFNQNNIQKVSTTIDVNIDKSRFHYPSVADVDLKSNNQQEIILPASRFGFQNQLSTLFYVLNYDKIIGGLRI